MSHDSRLLSQQDSRIPRNSIIASTDSRAGMLFQFCHRRGFVAGQSNSGNAVLNNRNQALFQIFEGHPGPSVVYQVILLELVNDDSYAGCKARLRSVGPRALWRWRSSCERQRSVCHLIEYSCICFDEESLLQFHPLQLFQEITLGPDFLRAKWRNLSLHGTRNYPLLRAVTSLPLSALLRCVTLKY